jgi:DNA-directed RNA polymerase specialized sigma24 family protein
MTFEECFVTMWPSVVNWFRMYLDDAENSAGDVFVRIVQAKPPNLTRSYVWAVCRSVITDHWRRRHAHGAPEAFESLYDRFGQEQYGHNHDYRGVVELLDVLAAMRRLPPLQAAAIVAALHDPPLSRRVMPIRDDRVMERRKVARRRLRELVA